ncbi:hypothetical protein, partial [Bradyrhizobium sp. SHOUNA76]|uniref:hypothetical protein n=1 Tax=Bradyrhizobium sp. SHOUNA76 TaxID=2908927 RepID=UPI002867F639
DSDDAGPAQPAEKATVTACQSSQSRTGAAGRGATLAASGPALGALQTCLRDFADSTFLQNSLKIRVA